MMIVLLQTLQLLQGKEDVDASDFLEGSFLFSESTDEEVEREAEVEGGGVNDNETDMTQLETVNDTTADMRDKTETFNLLDRAAFKEAQLNDETLKDAFEKAKNNHPGYIVHDGLLYRCELNKIFDVESDNMHRSRLAVPMQYRRHVLNTVHDGLFSGHLGVRKTQERLERSSGWLKCAASIALHIRSCHTCQMTAKKRKADRAPLCQTPIIENPMECVYLDFMEKFTPIVLQGRNIFWCFWIRARTILNYILCLACVLKEYARC